MKEFIVYNRELTDPEKELLEGYYTCKWDTRDTLPISHAYYNATGTDNTGCP